MPIVRHGCPSALAPPLTLVVSRGVSSWRWFYSILDLARVNTGAPSLFHQSTVPLGCRAPFGAPRCALVRPGRQ